MPYLNSLELPNKELADALDAVNGEKNRVSYWESREQDTQRLLEQYESRNDQVAPILEQTLEALNALERSDVEDLISIIRRARTTTQNSVNNQEAELNRCAQQLRTVKGHLAEATERYNAIHARTPDLVFVITKQDLKTQLGTIDNVKPGSVACGANTNGTPYIRWVFSGLVMTPGIVHYPEWFVPYDPDRRPKIPLQDCAVTVYPQTQIIDVDGNPGEIKDDYLDLTARTASERYRTIVWRLATGNMFYGLHRRSALVDAMPIPRVIGPDLVILARLAFQGTIEHVAEPLFLRRRQRTEETQEAAVARWNATIPATGGFRALRSEYLRELRTLPWPARARCGPCAAGQTAPARGR